MPPPFLLLPGLFILAAVSGGLIRARKEEAGGLSRSEALLCALPPVAIVIAAAAVIDAQGRYLAWDWNASRLAPLIALLNGYNLYYPANSGPILDTIYTPLSALAFLPAGLAGTPAWAVFAGIALAQCYYYLPAWALLCVDSVSGGRGARRTALLSCCALCCLTTLRPMLAYCAASIHADAPALGLMMLATLALARPGNSAWKLPAAAFFTAAAFWTKQTTVPLLAAFPAALWALEGRGKAVRLAAFELLFMLGFGATFCLLFGAREMLFNTVTIPGSHGWMRDMPEFTGRVAMPGEPLNQLRALRDAVAGFGGDQFLWLLIPCGMLTAGIASRGEWRTRLRLPLLLMAAGLFMLPTGSLGWIKIGGSKNSLGFIVLPHLLALMLLLREAALAPPGEPLRAMGRFGLAALLGGGLLLRASMFVLPNVDPGMWEWRGSSQAAYETERARPGEVYFPVNPLGPLMASGKLYMFDYGVQDRVLAGLAPTREHFVRHVPPNLKYIALPPPGGADAIMRHFPDFERVESPTGLEQFLVFGMRN